MKPLTLTLLLMLVAIPSLAQKGKRAAPPPEKAPPVVFTGVLPAEIVIREANRIYSIHVPIEGPSYWTYYDDSFNAYNAPNIDSGLFGEFQAVRAGDKVLLTFSFRRDEDASGLYKPQVSLRGVIELDFAQGFFTIFTKVRGTMSFDVLDGSRPSTAVTSESGCVTTRFVPLRCAIGVPPGFQSPIPTH